MAHPTITTASSSLNSTYSPQPYDMLQAIWKGMGGEIYQEGKDSYFKACKYNLLLHPQSQSSVAQMKVYCAKSMHTSTTTPSLSVHSSPVKTRLSVSRAPQSKFEIDTSNYERRPKAQDLTIEAEFHRYTLGNLSYDDSDILHFWEVSQIE